MQLLCLEKYRLDMYYKCIDGIIFLYRIIKILISV